MHECLKKICWGKVFLAAMAYLAISVTVQWISIKLTSNYLILPEYFSVWNKAMMPKLGQLSFEFTLASLGYSFLSGFSLAVLYSFLKDSFENCFCKQVSGFTLLISVLRLIFTYLPMLVLFNIPFLLVTSWFLVSIITIFLASLVFVKMLK